MEELISTFNPDAAQLDDFILEQTVRGSQTTLKLLLAHGIQGDFEGALSEYLDGGAKSCLKEAKRLAKLLVETLNKRSSSYHASPVVTASADQAES